MLVFHHVKSRHLHQPKQQIVERRLRQHLVDDDSFFFFLSQIATERWR